MTRDDVRILLDAMIPGEANRWPAAGDVLDPERMAAELGALLAGHAPGVPWRVETAPARLARLADEAPTILAALMQAVYAAYYTTPAVQAVIRELAESGPRDPSPRFDETLLAQVRARAAPPRRS